MKNVQILQKNIFIIFTFFVIIALISNNSVYSQNINKISTINSQTRDEGYILFAPEYHKNTYLIDHNGREVKVWENNYWQVLGTYLMENGNLIRTCSRLPFSYFPFGGFTGRVEMYDWNETLIWEFEYANNNVQLHHDIELLPNGNILMVAWESKSAQEAIEAGMNPNLISGHEVCPDHIIEVNPTYPVGGTIVWEWHVWDHLVQEYDETKENYGIVEDHPELININHQYQFRDLNHINSIDYNEKYDQILVSVRNYNEIWVIDHSTTTEEAAGHSGGRYGKGGDLLYRWGNSQAYHRGSKEDQQLFCQHDARWIEPDKPGEGNILMFNNGFMRPNEQFSSVIEIQPPINKKGYYFLNDTKAYGPEFPMWEYKAENSTDFYAAHLSGAERLPNGNTLICNGIDGYFFEVTPKKEIVWCYENTITKSNANPNSNDVFTIQYYPENYSGIGSTDYLDPEKPMKPNGNTILFTGRSYTFNTRTTDSNGDKIYYFFEWGDGTNSGWLGPYNSGKKVNATHNYRENGLYEIRVKAKDTNNFASQWSDKLDVNVAKSEVWLFGKVENITLKKSEIRFNTNKVILVSFKPPSFKFISSDIYMIVDDEYSGIVTNNFIGGKFIKKR